VIETRIEKKVIVTGDAQDIDHDKVQNRHGERCSTSLSTSTNAPDYRHWRRSK